MENQSKCNMRTAQKQRREALLLEGKTGKTVKDTLPDTSYLWSGEAEAMYSKGARDFLKTSLAYSIICGHQDIDGRS
ncbi:MAG: hypothetical protein HDR17_16215 [Lachnospiraceae bacterium]|nr:hypothetical protein [Lachnospiraceae bacterium]